MATLQPYSSSSPNPVLVLPKPDPIPVNRRWHIAKITIRAWSTLLATLIVILDIVLSRKAEQLDCRTRSFCSGTNTIIIWATSLAPAVLILAWNIAEFITLCFRRKSSGHGIHPGAHVGVDLIICIILAIISSNLFMYIRLVSPYDCDDDGCTVAEGYDASVRPLATAVTVLLFILFGIHLFLFIRACVEVHQRRKRVKDSVRVMIMPNGTNGGPYHNMAYTPQQMTLFQSKPPYTSGNGQAPQPLTSVMMVPPGTHPTHGYPAPAPAAAHQTPAQAYGGDSSPRQQEQMPQNTPETSPAFAGYYAPEARQYQQTGAYSAPTKTSHAQPAVQASSSKEAVASPNPGTAV